MSETEQILKLTGESFDEGAKAAITSLIDALELLHKLYPQLSFAEVIQVIKEMKEKSNITK